MHEGMKPEAAGAEVATVLMLRQLYVLVGKLHEAGQDGMGAWRDDLVRELRTRFAGMPPSEYRDGILKSAIETMDGVFNTITAPR